jgi:glucuronyl/N-acetylglucosaminyl transferase EXT2
MYNCFDIHRCGKDGHHRLSVYLYPVERWEVDGVLLNPQGLSIEFLQFLDALRKSPYLVEDPDDACIFVPTIDTLQMKDGDNLRLLTAFSSLP